MEMESNTPSNQIELSDFIKSVHQKLREDSYILGVEQAWQKHCEDENNLQKYATAMQDLATKHWDNNCKKGSKAVSRVEWVYHFIINYFNKEEIEKQRQKEIEIAHKMQLDLPSYNALLETNSKLQLLDVGSCYNPFKIYSCFNVLPIDIAPSNSDVYKCDFLNLQLTSKTPANSNSEITELQFQSFDVVVFSLLLEYLPSPAQRQLCCEKAYDLLKSEGILVIITPDSKHVGANAKIMKSWRFILAKLGFSRVKYEKLFYLHCMAFRKSIKKEIAQRWYLLQDREQFFNEMFIPQDFNKIGIIKTQKSNTSNCDISLFEELPFA